MTIEDVVRMAAALVGVEEPVTAYYEDGDEEGKRAVDALLACLHLVETELASEYFPLVTETEIVTDGKVYFDELEQTPLKILSVVDANGREVKHRVFAMYFAVPAGKYVVRYHYLPKKKGVGDELEFGGGVSTALMAYALAAKYCLIVGLYEESAVWDAKFREAVAAVKPLAKGLAMRARDWN